MTALQIHDGILHHQDCSGLITHLYHVDKLAFLLRLHAFEKKSEIFAVINSCSTLIPSMDSMTLTNHSSESAGSTDLWGKAMSFYQRVIRSGCVFGPAASFSRNIPQGDQCYPGYVLYELKPELLPPVTDMLTTPSTAPQFHLPPRFP